MTDKKVSFYAILRLMRPKQWIKNSFVLAPLIFSGVFNEQASFMNAIIAFLLFCVASSATYVLNDYQDIENDRKHPIKSKKRPLASGEVTKVQAKVLMILLYSSLAVSFVFFPKILLAISAYLLLNIAYSFYLKHQPVLDIFTIASGFVLRVFAGAVAISVPLSSWMFITTLSLALYLAAIKRRQELAKSGNQARKVLKHYTVELVDKYAEMSATCAILFYSLFVISDRPQLVFTIPFVLFGLYRYWFVVESEGEGESPTDALFSDKQLQLTIAGWVLACIYSFTY
ncbi:decaprenyl-phosphate phosphoribosyltransferase [Pseudoalteromonas spongiae]|uniref:decaprenyl-phosphate phosphoribosyltransferase n=1 Tax=Pseudoalteromonas spongiae TaxID=298657 RepID=UPI00110BA422|nr:decaprenyl-phosphate phosphoribosyltransferase [Pseudoalteromonas spongiae]TMO83720.1 decaprenyl-phosphate phosphoribosyltransferase [Pseudoalteromonas spongiae]